ncbi:SUKH-3 domain-containing protein [Streptomyces sp. KR80]|uniref:SUKH-3 domain-containing protein n=1 Tax=Streptomyces sp. KR80 TaxID=3457426 RepID=UPI003FD4E171
MGTTFRAHARPGPAPDADESGIGQHRAAPRSSKIFWGFPSSPAEVHGSLAVSTDCSRPRSRQSDQNESMSPEVDEALRAAGWLPGRRIDTTAWRAELEQEGLRIHEAAEVFLREFGGLDVRRPFSSSTTCTTPAPSSAKADQPSSAASQPPSQTPLAMLRARASIGQGMTAQW